MILLLVSSVFVVVVSHHKWPASVSEHQADVLRSLRHYLIIIIIIIVIIIIIMIVITIIIIIIIKMKTLMVTVAQSAAKRTLTHVDRPHSLTHV